MDLSRVSVRLHGDEVHSRSIAHAHLVRELGIFRNQCELGSLDVFKREVRFDDGSIMVMQKYHDIEIVNIYTPEVPVVEVYQELEKATYRFSGPVPVISLHKDYWPYETVGSLVMDKNFIPLHWEPESPINYDDIVSLEIKELTQIGTPNLLSDDYDYTPSSRYDSGWQGIEWFSPPPPDVYTGHPGPWWGPTLGGAYYINATGGGDCQLSWGNTLAQNYCASTSTQVPSRTFISGASPANGISMFYQRYYNGQIGRNWSECSCCDMGLCMGCGTTWTEIDSNYTFEDPGTATRTGYIRQSGESWHYFTDTGERIDSHSDRYNTDVNAVSNLIRNCPPSHDSRRTSVFTNEGSYVWGDIRSSKVVGVENYVDHKTWIGLYTVYRYEGIGGSRTVEWTSGDVIDESSSGKEILSLVLNIMGKEIILDEVVAWDNVTKVSNYNFPEPRTCGIYDYHGTPVFVFSYLNSNRCFCYGFYYDGELTLSPEYPRITSTQHHDIEEGFHNTGTKGRGIIRAAEVTNKRNMYIKV